MRTITEKDKKGLAEAARVLIRSFSGERLRQETILPLVEEALDAGLSFDAILNKENWARALAVQGDLTFKDYIDVLCEHGIDVREIKDEPMWYEPANRFDTIAEAAHDFYLEVTGEGGKWNIPSALTLLAKAIREHSLQAVLSEKLFEDVRNAEGEEKMTWFNYLAAIVKDFNTLPINNEPTQAQLDREKEAEKIVEAAIEEPEEGTETEAATPGDGTVDDGQPNDIDPYENFDPFEKEQMETGFESVVITQKNPNEIKRSCLKIVLGNYTPNDLLGLVGAVDGDGMNLPIEEIVNRLTYGRFFPKKEDEKTREIHRQINADLLMTFVETVSTQGIPMTEEIAAEYDILHESWDQRSPKARKLHKLLRLIYSEGKDDPDLLGAVADLEKLYEDNDDETED